jgi:hypothetical protein
MRFFRSFLFCLAILFTVQALAQTGKPWLRPLDNRQLSFYEVQAAFTKAYKKKGKKILKEKREELRESRRKNKGKLIEKETGAEAGYFQFRRWEDYYGPRVFPSGDLSLPSTTWDRLSEYLAATPTARTMYQASTDMHNRTTGTNRTLSGSWTFAGPVGAPASGGAGRINFVKVSPANPNVLFAGGPNSGLWKSTDGGANWTTNTDVLSVIGCTDLVFDPTNSQTLFLATGDGDAADCYSIGVLKSTDGGQTWNTTGLTFPVSQQRVISKLLINPGNPSIIMAATNVGLFRSTNGGTTWTQLQGGTYFADIEFKPGDPATVYAAGYDFFRSTDGGATWSVIDLELPSGDVIGRLAIAVTPANNSYVYLLATNEVHGFYGLYRSTNSGTSFFTRSTGTTLNILGWEADGTDVDAGGQGWYDLAIDASPTNADEIKIGGINIWQSTTGGSTWSLNAHWTGNLGTPYVHADIHSLSYLNSSTLYTSSDGGVYKSTDNGTTWTDISSNMCIAQVYRIGQSASNASLWLTGHQDNGTNLYNGTTYSEVIGGDGMACFIDRTNNNVMYGSLYNGWFHRTTNGGASWNDLSKSLSEDAEWVAPWCQDPANANTIWAGLENVWRSTDKGDTWVKMGTLPTSGTVSILQVAPSNNKVVYAFQRGVNGYPYTSALYKTTVNDTTWTDITGTLPVSKAMMTGLAIKPTDPNTVWVCFSGYTSGTKVYKTTNGGSTWANVSTGLPNLPVNCIKADPGSSADALYVGADVGVYYIDNTFSSWQPYFTNLPNVSVQDIQIYSPASKVRVATFGRGVWENILFTKTLPLTLLSFDGSLTAQKAADLKWKTANETALSHYEIEHSTSNVNFAGIGTKKAAGTTAASYGFIHLQTVNGSNYYRLKMVNADGSFTYSEVVKLDIERKNFVTQVSPNPFATAFKLTIESPLATKAEVRLSDAAGKTIAVKHVPLSQGVNEIDFDASDVKQNGVYLLHIEAADYRNVIKVLKTN